MTFIPRGGQLAPALHLQKWVGSDHRARRSIDAH
jgi:hypothetical protein